MGPARSTYLLSLLLAACAALTACGGGVPSSLEPFPHGRLRVANAPGSGADIAMIELPDRPESMLAITPPGQSYVTHVLPAGFYDVVIHWIGGGTSLYPDVWVGEEGGYVLVSR